MSSSIFISCQGDLAAPAVSILAPRPGSRAVMDGADSGKEKPGFCSVSDTLMNQMLNTPPISPPPFSQPRSRESRIHLMYVCVCEDVALQEHSHLGSSLIS